MAKEKDLNHYYNIGKFNHPSRIGYMMKMIRDVKPITEDEWKMWYLDNVHDEQFIKETASEMYQIIPEHMNVREDECFDYVNDVMFHRTFKGYNKEKLALKVLREVVSPNVQESPAEWDTKFFIDFYVYGNRKNLIGMQLKPDTFFTGHYQYKVDIKGKMDAFCREYNAKAYILTYDSEKSKEINEIEFTDPKVIEEIRNQL